MGLNHGLSDADIVTVAELVSKADQWTTDDAATVRDVLTELATRLGRANRRATVLAHSDDKAATAVERLLRALGRPLEQGENAADWGDQVEEAVTYACHLRGVPSFMDGSKPCECRKPQCQVCDPRLFLMRRRVVERLRDTKRGVRCPPDQEEVLG